MGYPDPLCQCDGARGETRNPHNHGVVTGASLRAHNRDRTGDLILTKDVLYRLSYVSDPRTAYTTSKDYADREELSVDESEVIGNPFRRALAWSRTPVGTLAPDRANVIMTRVIVPIAARDQVGASLSHRGQGRRDKPPDPCVWIRRLAWCTTMIFAERETGLEPATSSLEG